MKRNVQIFVFIVIVSGFFTLLAYKIDKAVDERETKCHGQCATGNPTERHDCKKMCDKLTVCPTYGAD
jgi:hypothetical protein